MPAMKRPASVASGRTQATKLMKMKADVEKPKAPAAQGVEVPKRGAPKGPFAQVIKGLASSDLPTDARDLLADMMVVSLSTSKDKRDKYQSKVVEMVNDALVAVDEALQNKIKELDLLMSEDVQTKEDFESKLNAKESEVESKHADVLARKEELAEVAKSFKLARQAAQEAEVQERGVELEAKGKMEEREMLANLREDLLGPVDEAKAEDLVKRLTVLAVSDSMTVALPAVLAKAPSERGSFDAMVLTSVREELDTRIVAADEVIQNVEPAKAAKAKALFEAQVALKEVAKQQVDGAARYRSIHSQEEALETEAAELQFAIRKLKETWRKHSSMSAKAKRNLEVFQTGPKHAFETLREVVAESTSEVVPAIGEAMADPEEEAAGAV